MLKTQKKLVGFIGVFGIIVSALTIFLLSHPVAADTYPPDSSGNCRSSSDTKTTNATGATVCQTAGTSPTGQAQPGQQGQATDATTCAIEKVGWILCPVIETAGKVGDQAFEQLSKHFLETEPELVASVSGNTKPGTYVAWELARNIANIMFIIAFLIIIFSQVTGRGIDNYGIKKLLPKLIIAAIAVNISYYICQAMVDLTNILGYEIENFMINTAQQVSDKVAMPPQTGIDVQTSHGTLGTIALGVLGAAAIVWFLLPILFLGISTVVIVCLVIIVILLMRKAFIVLLVVASPIAFVFYLLPNTERLFQKWLRMFWQLLMVFPIVGLLFGGGQLASAIILIAGTNTTTDATSGKGVYADSGSKCIQLPSWPDKNNSSTTQTADSGAKIGNCGTRSTPFMLGLVAAGVAVAPLFAVWAVLKGALSAAGTLGGKISGAVQNAGNKSKGIAGKPEDWLRKRASENIQAAWQRRSASGLESGTGIAGGLARRRARRDKRLELSKADLDRAKQDYLNNDVLNEKDPYGVLTGLSNKAQNRAITSGEAAREHVLAEDVKAASMTVRNMSDKGKDGLEGIVDDLRSGKRTVEDPMVAAAIDELGKRQQFAQLERVLNHVANSGPSLAARTLSQTLSQNAPELVTGGQIGALSRGALAETGFSGQNAYADMVAANLGKGIITAEKAAGAGPAVLEEAARNATSQAAKQALVNSANAAINDPILRNKIGRNAGILSNFSQGKNASGQNW